jgi:ubiquinone/menaquinone biosynthesis C-methylase UbiE
LTDPDAVFTAAAVAMVRACTNDFLYDIKDPPVMPLWPLWFVKNNWARPKFVMRKICNTDWRKVMKENDAGMEIAEQVKVVGEPWRESAYYEYAEGRTHVFWDESTVFRKMFECLDLTAVIELACGHGRHAEKCIDRCGSMMLMDIFQNNLDISMDRLKGSSNVFCCQSDGYTFRPVEDGSITSIFCYDAMVHFTPDIVESYLEDAFRVLSKGGQALFHHSNYPAPLDRHYGLNPHARNHMTQVLFIELAQRHGLEVVESQVIHWREAVDLDCVSLVRKP